MVRVEGSRTAGMLEAWRWEYLRDLLSEEDRALEVSRARPARGGSARVRVDRVEGMGRDRV